MSNKCAITVAIIIAFLAAMLFPWITGFGTVLFQMIIFCLAWRIVAIVLHVSPIEHEYLVIATCGVINASVVGIAVCMLHFATQRLSRWVFQACLLIFVVLYLCCLFILWPATDGP
jgi:hypothetical protein